MGIPPSAMLSIESQYSLLVFLLFSMVVAIPRTRESEDTNTQLIDSKDLAYSHDYVMEDNNNTQVTDGKNLTKSLYDVVEDTNSQATDSKDLQPSNVATCDQIMTNNGLNFSSFWHGAAHGIHSIYLEEIREYFEPNTTIHNKIPVVNPDLSAEQTILFDSPLAGYDEDFRTMALKVMAYFMTHDKPDFATQGLNTLEKLTHQYHMHEIYKAAAPIYRRMKNNPPNDPELCPCVNDITGNGILLEMVNIAQQLKYFNSMRRPRNGRAVASRDYSVLGGLFNYKRDKRSADEDITEYEETYLTHSNKENAEQLLAVRPWIPNTLQGPEQWVSYEAMLTKSMLNEEELNDFAVFMYCKLNQPELDHPKELFDRY